MNVTGNQDKESRKPCKNSGWPQKDSAEHEEYAGALTDPGITENNITNGIEASVSVYDPNSNLMGSYDAITDNNGTATVRHRLRRSDPSGIWSVSASAGTGEGKTTFTVQ